MSEQILPTRLVDDGGTCEADSLAETGAAPPFPAQVAPAERVPEQLLGLPAAGQTLGDFELLRVLGSGAFARVYLARQVSLGRQVALKVSRTRGQEARTLAPLEHDHIVRVFSETIEQDRQLCLLCMQYVPGVTLERIIAGLHALPAGERSGRAILDLIDEQATDAATLDLGALRDREALAQMDLLEASCWMGARLAEALAYAHDRGVLHRDVKPANVLVNRYGRPLLADFNVAVAGDAEQGLGGTAAYMAPEHLDAFARSDFTAPAAVDARSDLWSLGAVVYELLTGRQPYPIGSTEGPAFQVFRNLSAQRHQPPPRVEGMDAPAALQRVFARCLAPRQEDRYSKTADLAVDLDSCRELRRVQGELPAAGALTRWCQASPFLAALALTVVPHVMGTLVNIPYNALRIVSGLPKEQQDWFWNWLVPLYNVVVWTLCLTAIIRQLVPVYAAWDKLRRAVPIDAAAIDDARRRALTLPFWAALLACLGWIVSGVVFPLLLTGRPEPLGWDRFGHFLFSFTISGLIALTYSVLGIEFVVLRVLYPALWLDARRLRETARQELDHVEGRVSMLQFFAVLIPLAGVALMVGTETENRSTFRVLVTGLLAIGMVGLGLALLAGHRLRQCVSVLTAGKRR